MAYFCPTSDKHIPSSGSAESLDRGEGLGAALKFVLTPQNYSQNVFPGQGEGLLLKQNQFKK